MPIQPENRKLYPPPKVWRAIRAAVQLRAGDKCEWCNVPNHTLGFRFPDGRFEATQGCCEERPKGARAIQIICTTAHVDHDPRHNDGFEQTGVVKPLAESNLAFLCQRCHLNHDRKDHIRNRRTNLDKRRGQVRMFEKEDR